ncbi:hypothetical protein LDENG_00298840, partial [Lucifuga dentata]
KDLPKQVCDKVVEGRTSGEGYKKICKALNIPGNTVKSIIKKWKVQHLPKSGRPSKVSNGTEDNWSERHRESSGNC